MAATSIAWDTAFTRGMGPESALRCRFRCRLGRCHFASGVSYEVVWSYEVRGGSGPDSPRRCDNRVAPRQRRAISFSSVKSASTKPRLAGRQPSNRGGVPRVMTRLSSRHRLHGKRGSVMTGPPSPQENK